MLQTVFRIPCTRLGRCNYYAAMELRVINAIHVADVPYLRAVCLLNSHMSLVQGLGFLWIPELSPFLVQFSGPGNRSLVGRRRLCSA